ncbi:MAG TPA: MarR family transcriptional regulator [Gemmatimonadales bacterium]|nr:MarR family transcriptional regulator [Gemmatimonadales bacterium]
MDFIEELGALALDHRLRRMMDTLLSTAEEVYRARGLEFRPRWTSTYLLLDREGALPLTEIAQRIRLTHPGVIGITDEMHRAGLVTYERDRGDGRRRLIGLTLAAKRLKPELQRVWTQLASVQAARFSATGCDILDVLAQVEAGLAVRPFTVEVLEKLGPSARSVRRPTRAGIR